VSTAPGTSLRSLHLAGVEHLQKKWGWFLAIGILLIVLGMIAIGSAFTMTLASVAAMVMFGWLMILGGALQTLHAFACRSWSGFFLDLLAGILYMVMGFMIVANPLMAATALTLLIAMFLIIGGIFRIVAAIAVRYQNWIWVLLHGVINVALGAMIWKEWPASGLWVIGLFIGIDMIFNGWALVMLGIAAKNLPAAEKA